MAGAGRSDRVSMHLEAGETERDARPLPGTPFHIALFGDFSARGARPGAAPRAVAERRPVPVDRDDIDDVLARLAPELHVRVNPAAPPVTVHITGLDDFHPDRLFESVPELAAVRALRQRLADRRTADAAVRELLGPPGGATAAAAPAPSRAGAAVLEDILSETSGPAMSAAAPEEKDGLVRFIREALAGNVVADVDPRQGALLARLDREIGLRIGAILHEPHFQALEALWRGVQLLVRRLETGPELKLFLVDVTQEELASDLLEQDVAESGVYRLLLGKAGEPGASPWALLVGCYSFGPDRESVRLLGQLGALARAVRAPWLAAAELALAGVLSPGEEVWSPEDRAGPGSQEWEELRGRPEAAWLGLVAPRFLLRPPYGAENEPCESFPFEELRAAPANEHFLWGNPALAAALLLGNAFSAEGWGMRAGAAVARAEIGGLPMPLLRRADGDVFAYPCVELPLPEDSAARMLDDGVMPLIAQGQGGAIRLLQLRSVARTPGPLPGRWTAPA